MNSAESHVSFVVTGFNESPSVVSALMGISPTRAWRKGEEIPGHKNGKQTHDRWELKSSLPLTEPISLHLAEIIKVLELSPHAVKATLERFEGGLSIACYYKDHNPGFNLSSQLLKQVSALNLSVDFDLYFVGDGV